MFELINLNSSLLDTKTVNEILDCNNISSLFGLALTEQQAKELVETKTTSLKSNGRIEFGGGIVSKIIQEFCDSPFINKQEYSKILNELTEIFYIYKNETLDQISDEDLIHFMKVAYNGVCKGSLDLLSGRELYNLARSIRFQGLNSDETKEDEEPIEDE